MKEELLKKLSRTVLMNFIFISNYYTFTRRILIFIKKKKKERIKDKRRVFMKMNRDLFHEVTLRFKLRKLGRYPFLDHHCKKRHVSPVKSETTSLQRHHGGRSDVNM